MTSSQVASTSPGDHIPFILLHRQRKQPIRQYVGPPIIPKLRQKPAPQHPSHLHPFLHPPSTPIPKTWQPFTFLHSLTDTTFPTSNAQAHLKIKLQDNSFLLASHMKNPPAQRYYKIARKSAEQQTPHTLSQPVSKETTQLERTYGCLLNEACNCYDDLIIAQEQLDEACKQKNRPKRQLLPPKNSLSKLQGSTGLPRGN